MPSRQSLYNTLEYKEIICMSLYTENLTAASLPIGVAVPNDGNALHL
jgi:hypothetical protein